MLSKLARKRVVAEVSMKWTGREASNPEYISQKFARVIARNLEKGLELESWQYQSVVVSKQIYETIVAVFVEMNPDPRQQSSSP